MDNCSPLKHRRPVWSGSLSTTCKVRLLAIVFLYAFLQHNPRILATGVKWKRHIECRSVTLDALDPDMPTVAGETAPGLKVHNEVTVVEVRDPGEEETL